MTQKKDSKASTGFLLVVITGLIFLGSCGGSSSSSSGSTPTSPAANNTAPVTVGFGALGASGGYVNGIWASVTVCVPGSTTNCQTINNVLVDTGSIGLRVLSSAFTNFPASSLGAITDSNGDQLQECIQYGDTSYTWGSVMLADVGLAGEKASSIPIQVIGGNTFDVPGACIATPIVSGLPNGGNDDTVEALGANGILGIEGYPWDCGSACASVTFTTGYPYYICPGGQCSPASVAAADQATNPVAAFSSTDNNGVLITLPAIGATGAADAATSGSLIFGIGTQSNNALSSSATVYGVDGYGNIPQAHYNGVQYTSPSNVILLDTGSNALYVFDAATLASVGITDCSDAQGYYCPGSSVSLGPIALSGYNSTSGTVSLSIANADTLFASGNAAFNNLGGDGGTGPSNDTVDIGLPFFFGRSVYVGMMPAAFTGESAAPSAASGATNGYFAF
jgi:Protein of unknown function (DUF3443)